jgi:L-iditol 2-dehydrogenase
MLAVLARGPGFEGLSVERVPVPRPGPGQLLARVDAAGVCTSILKLLDQGQDHPFVNGWDMARWPLILGDEGSVTVVAAGAGLGTEYPAGRRFAIQPAVAAPPVCHRERYRDALPGHLAEYILIQEEVLRAECLLPLPDERMPRFAVSMAEPISCVVSAQERQYHLVKDGPHAPRRPRLGLLPRGVAVVIGAGAMGRLHAELALRFAPRALIACDPVASRLDRVRHTLAGRARGAGTELLCAGPAELEKVVGSVSGGLGADDIILAVGSQQAQQDALRLLAPGGVANLFGGLPKGRHTLEVNALDVHYREIKLVGSSGGEPSDLKSTLDLIAAGAVDPGNYVAAVGSLDDAIEVLRLIRETKMDGKAILYPRVRPTPLRFVERWSGADEEAFLAERAARPADGRGGSGS